HHLMLDGWSGAIVLNQVVEAYGKLQEGERLMFPVAPTYQDYIRWQGQQDESATAAFWRSTLVGFERPTPLPLVTDVAQAGEAAELQLAVEESAAVQVFLRSQKLTLNTLVQGLWTLLLYGCSGKRDVLFGTTVSGRQADLPGVEKTVGLLINVLPVRVQVRDSQTLLDWLQDLQQQQIEASKYAHASLAQIQDWCELPGRPFESLLVIENYPTGSGDAERSLTVENVRSGVVSTYELTLLIKPGEQLTLAAESRYGRELEAMLLQLCTLLAAAIQQPNCTVQEIVASAGIMPVEQAHCEKFTTSQPVSADISRETLEGEFTAPQNALELDLLRIWSSVLEVGKGGGLSVEDSFFDAGGDSLRAIQLFNQMQQQLNCTLPLATLFRAPSVRRFAALLGRERLGKEQDQGNLAVPWSSLVPIQPGNSRGGMQQPFFFHGGSADALTWARFSRLLGSDQPFYALQRPDLDGREVTPMSVEALAAGCVREIRMVQPKGPYLLGGHCFGGAVAFEIAQQLQAEGEQIASLILIDAYRPEVLPDGVLTSLQLKLNLGLFWLRKNYYYHGGKEKIAQLPRKVLNRLGFKKSPQKNPKEKNTGPLAELKTQPSNNRESQTFAPKSQSDSVQILPYEYRYARAQEANEIAADQYIAQPYAGEIRLFRANTQTLDWYFGPKLGWQTVAKAPVSVTVLPGFFGNLFNQRSGPLLAEAVKAHLMTVSNCEVAEIKVPAALY
ncbi:MAG: alpha/beta fold hydrolase, partial [Cyanobacteria bacterium J06554_11]